MSLRLPTIDSLFSIRGRSKRQSLSSRGCSRREADENEGIPEQLVSEADEREGILEQLVSVAKKLSLTHPAQDTYGVLVCSLEEIFADRQEPIDG